MRNTCIMEGCERHVTAHGLCPMHNYRKRRHGSPYITKKPGNGVAIAFFEQSVSHGGDGCLIWPFAKNRTGYGVLGQREVHRLMCIRVNGPPPSPTHQAAHNCGKGKSGCMNPRHLQWKTPSENALDKYAHGTFLFGERGPRAVLNNEKVWEIRAVAGKERAQTTAERYGVSRRLVNKIQRREVWAHLGERVPS